MTELLRTLCLTSAPSGREGAVMELIQKEIEPYCDSLSFDKIGNLIARITPENAEEKIMFSAHADECGFMVKSIDGEGRAHLSMLGQVDSRTLSGRRVRFLCGAVGLVAVKPIHILSEFEESKPTPTDRLALELGAKDREEAQNIVKIGEFGTFEPRFTPLANGFYAGKAAGGRSALIVLLELVKEAKKEKEAGTLKKDCYFVFSVKREIGGKLFAIETAAYTIAPDMAVVFDAQPVCDFGEFPEHGIGAKCGGGFVLAPADMRTMYDREMFAEAVNICEKKQLAYQYPSMMGAGGEAGTIHKNGAGIRTLSVGIPTRNLHSGTEIVQMRDIEAASAFAKAWLSENGR